MITDFITWLENDSIQRQIEHPASAEVLRTGLQPQVGANSNNTDNPDQDKIMALDTHVERIKTIVKHMKPNSNLGQKMQKMCMQFCNAFDKLLNNQNQNSDETERGLADRQTSDAQLKYMKDNQPLPEPPRTGIPGGDVPM